MFNILLYGNINEYDCLKQRVKQTLNFIPPMHYVEEECNMIEFAKQKDENYDPDSGKGYFQLTEKSQEYISSTTDVLLISEVNSYRQ